MDAEQLAVEPPLEPTQVHDHGPEPDTADAVPTLQSPVVGADNKLAPLLEPQAPFTFLLAKQLALVPPNVPLQNHRHGPEPETADAAPTLHRFDEGADRRLAPFEEPQTPLTEAKKSCTTLPDVTFPALREAAV